jgi:hypothetical protein
MSSGSDRDPGMTFVKRLSRLYFSSVPTKSRAFVNHPFGVLNSSIPSHSAVNQPIAGSSSTTSVPPRKSADVACQGPTPSPMFIKLLEQSDFEDLETLKIALAIAEDEVL